MTQTLLHGDCLELLPTLADGSVSLVFADLPYSHISGGKVRKCTANAWDTPIDLAALWTQLLRVGKRNAPFVFTATQPFATTLINSQPKLFRYDLVWDRETIPTGFMNARKMPLRIHESIWVFYKALPTYNPQKTPGNAYHTTKGFRGENWPKAHREKPPVDNPTGDRFPVSVLRLRRNRSEGRTHPTQKPVTLLEWLIRTYSNPGDTVLDPTMGSGTTGVACINTDRKFIGIEKDAGYYAIAQRRVESAQPPLPGAA